MGSPALQVIKRGRTGQLARQLATLDLADHMDEARAVIDGARRRAARRLSDAQAEAQRIRKKAFESGRLDGHAKGYDAGYKTGHDEGLSQALKEARERLARDHDELIQSVSRMTRQFDQKKKDLLIQARQDCLVFAVELAAKLTRRQGQYDPGVVTENVRRALRQLMSRTDVTIRVHPKDLKTARTLTADIESGIAAAEHVTFVEDASIAPGGAIVSDPLGTVDASLDTQLEELTSLLLGTNKENNPPNETARKKD